MEKRAVISPECTPAEKDEQPLPEEKRAQISTLDADFRKRLATAAADKIKEV